MNNADGPDGFLKVTILNKNESIKGRFILNLHMSQSFGAI